MLLPMSWCGLLPLSVNAVLSATTVNTIQGTKPYLTFDEGKTRAIDTKTLLSLTLSDGTVYTQDSNSSSVSNPIALPVSGQSINDVKLFIPEGKDVIDLNELVGSPYNYWGDDDGDGQGNGGIKATGSLSVAITDKSGNSVSRNEPLSLCHAPYTITLKATDGALSTQYGDPSVTDFNASSVIYYIGPSNVNMPHVCFAKPNLEKNYGTQPEWDGNKGFKLQSLSDPKKNFPRTGFHGAFFDIAIEKATAESIISTTGNTITQGGVTATLTAQSANVVRIMLTGPNNASGGGRFEPSTFTIKSNSTDAIYSFALSKWFVIRPGEGGGYSNVKTYCRNLTGSYRIPSVSEFTNANGYGWSGGLAGWGNSYARAIGNGKQKTAISGDDGVGGLFAEWGYVSAGTYPGSNSYYAYYWAIEPFSNHMFLSESGYGKAYHDATSNRGHRGICVTP